MGGEVVANDLPGVAVEHKLRDARVVDDDSATERKATEALSIRGYDEAVLWVIPENARARALYESEEWIADGASQSEEVLGVAVREIRYRKAPLRSA